MIKNRNCLEPVRADREIGLNFNKESGMKISITYCAQWNYKPRAAGLAAKIKQALGTEPELVPKGGGIFDVAVDNKLVYSKFKTGSFPDESQLVDELVAAYGSWHTLLYKQIRLDRACHFLNFPGPLFKGSKFWKPFILAGTALSELFGSLLSIRLPFGT